MAKERECAEFVKWALQNSSWEGSDLDGGEVQDKARKLGLIKKTVYDPDEHGEDDYCEPGDPYYVVADDVEALLRNEK
jgi:hypothetical protein